MIKEFKLPDLGEGLKEATLVAWKVKEGDVVKAEQEVAEVETDKATTPLPIPFAGKIVKLHGKPGEVLKVGAVIVSVETDAASPSPAPMSAAPSPPQKAPVSVPAEKYPSPTASAPTLQRSASAAPASMGSASSPTPTPPAATGQDQRPVLAAPATRRLARERGIDLRLVPGTGPGGRVTTEDVLNFAGGKAGPTLSADLIEPVPAAVVGGIQRPELPNFANYGPVERQPASPIRKRIAQRMVLSQAICATVTHADEADVTELETLRRSAKAAAEQRGFKLTLLPFVMKAVVAALKTYPLFNASYDDDKQEIIYKRYYHIGVAVDSPQGLLVPVVRDVDRRPITEIAKDLVHLAEAARTGKIAADQMRGGTFTITNIGALGGLSFTPIINWPELAILGTGRLQERPVLRDDELTNRLFLPLCLSFDHRLIDGADAARFTNAVKEYLENPALLLAMI